MTASLIVVTQAVSKRGSVDASKLAQLIRPSVLLVLRGRVNRWSYSKATNRRANITDVIAELRLSADDALVTRLLDGDYALVS